MLRSEGKGDCCVHRRETRKEKGPSRDLSRRKTVEIYRLFLGKEEAPDGTVGYGASEYRGGFSLHANRIRVGSSKANLVKRSL